MVKGYNVGKSALIMVNLVEWYRCWLLPLIIVFNGNRWVNNLHGEPQQW